MKPPKPNISTDNGVPLAHQRTLTTPSSTTDACPVKQLVQTTLDELHETIRRLSDETRHTQDALTRLSEDVQALRADDTLVRELQAECRELREQFHERETLGPVLRTLIAQADRCRQNMSSLRDLVRGRSPTDIDSVEGVRIGFMARKGDLAEIEAILAVFGVESFKHHDSNFSPQHQKCVGRVTTHDRQQANRIAQRVYPGYRRHGAVLQPERVKVYVYEPQPPRSA